ncbi:MAG: peptidylprolyl isomerase [Alphaproteobacteria bacterium]
MDLPAGRVVIEMYPDIAPRHVARIRELAAQGFYDGLAFHRVIDDFVAQGGDPTGTGTGGSGKTLRPEFSQTVKHVRGIVSMARAADPDSADSQFFIMLGDAPYLDGKYTIWGRVIAGMEFVDALKRGQGHADPDRIVRMRPVAAAR